MRPNQPNAKLIPVWQPEFIAAYVVLCSRMPKTVYWASPRSCLVMFGISPLISFKSGSMFNFFLDITVLKLTWIPHLCQLEGLPAGYLFLSFFSAFDCWSFPCVSLYLLSTSGLFWGNVLFIHPSLALSLYNSFFQRLLFLITYATFIRFMHTD